MSVIDCLARLVTQGKITKQQATDARSIYDGVLQDDMLRNMDQATKEGFAALKTAEALTDAANAKKQALARRATIFNANLERINEHPKGPLDGYMALYTRDLYGHSDVNVEGMKSYYGDQLAAKNHALVDAYEPKAAGLKQDVTGIRDVVYENHGVKTGNEVAAKASKGWQDATKWGLDQATRLGKVFKATEDWRQPQFWDAKRLNKLSRGEFVKDIRDEIAKGGLDIHDPESGKLLTGDAREQVISDAAQHIMGDVSKKNGASTVFKDEMRVFRFKDGKAGADSYLRMMDKYGPGQGGYLGMMAGHLDKMSHEIAMLHVMGPSPRAMSEALLDAATKGDAARARPSGFSMTKVGDAILSGSGLRGPNAAKRMHEYMTGQLSGVGSEAVAGIMEGARSWLVASNMGSAIVTAVPTDTVNWMMAANYRNLNAGRMAENVTKAFLTADDAGKAMAARLGIVAHAVSRTAIGTKQFGDQVVGSKLMSRMADFVVKAQGLHAWDAAISRAWSMEFLASLGERQGKSFGELEPAFQDFFKQYGMDESHWNGVNRGKLLMDGGDAKFLDPDSLDHDVRAKVMSAIYNERQFAYLAGGTARVRALATGGAKAGTPAGEMARSLMMFKNFPLTLAATWGVRAAQDAAQGKLGVAVQLGAFVTLAGALSVQARQMLQGKDPKDMAHGAFWAESAFQGGALGIYGDYLKDVFGHNGSTLTESLLGPLAQFPNALGGLGSSARRAAEEGTTDHVNFGAALANDIQKFTPGSNLWYARLILNRMIFDNIRKEMDPDYAQGFQRQVDRAKKDGQNFYWLPGHNAPSQAPDMGAMLGGSH